MEQLSGQEVTVLLREWSAGDRGALERLMPLVYGELRKIAASHLRSERGSHTLQPTALVHEAYLRLVGQRSVSWANRAHFYGIAAQMMRRVLVDHARRRQAAKRNPWTISVALPEGEPGAADRAPELLALDLALTELERLDPRQARVVELRFFAGLSVEETAEVAGISTATVKREWRTARAFLRHEIGPGSEP
ncbi:MAG TPA: sigma-70 family RNA polymerase sigma factor [Thermoanaerobaculia bacterium]|jgi:RNA polymerase sigma factor (TIGR02999 family)|nr:sigma-70 family RNA polymerase sigma factor [Thermoanaerobaculia bacterium]